MPATLLISLWIGLTLLLPGAKENPIKEAPSGLALSRSTVAMPHQPMIRAVPPASSEAWLPSDATFEEEESSDTDENVIVAERCWSLPRLTLFGQESTIRPDRGFSRPAIRSTVLRC